MNAKTFRERSLDALAWTKKHERKICFITTCVCATVVIAASKYYHVTIWQGIMSYF